MLYTEIYNMLNLSTILHKISGHICQDAHRCFLALSHKT